jgi:non-heme chloroperoxidase
MRIWQARSADGTRLHVREHGPEDAPPIVLVHGWSQCHLAWKKQLGSELARDYRLIAFDLRGHGMSDVPAGHEAYTRGQRWAEDVHAVVEQSGARGTLLVGWSHGSFVVADYLRWYGDAALRGVVLMSWAVKIGASPELRQYIGPGFADFAQGAMSQDLPESIAAIRMFVREMFAKPIPADDHEEALCYNMVVPPHVHRWTTQHEPVDNSEVLAAVRVPLWAAHGGADHVVLPGALGMVRAASPDAAVTTYPGAGHAPFLEDPEAFNTDLRAFAERVFAVGTGPAT